MSDSHVMKVAAADLYRLRSQQLYRELRVAGGPAGKFYRQNGKSHLNLVSNNYLGLANHEKVVEVSRQALERWGLGAGSARLLGGTQEPHAELEEKLAEWTGCESALLFNSGYVANLGILQVLAECCPTVFSDKNNHASIVDGIRMPGVQLKRYAHNDMDHLANLLKGEKDPSQCFLISETLFSMDGDFAPLKALAKLQESHGFFVVLDMAHSFGGYPELKEKLEAFDPDRLLLMGTLGKALGSFGAFVAGRRVLREWMLNKARTFIFTTALPPVCAAGALAALEVLEREPHRLRQLKDNVSQFHNLWNKKRRTSGGGQAEKSTGETRVEKSTGGTLGPSTGGSHIVPVILGDNSRALQAVRDLENRGYYVAAIRHPTVPVGTARLRLSLNAELESTEIKELVDALAGLPLLEKLEKA